MGLGMGKKKNAAQARLNAPDAKPQTRLILI
jgi:hypothetical protein